MNRSTWVSYLTPNYPLRDIEMKKIMMAKQGIGIIKYLSKFLPLKTLDQMYKALVRPYLDYCDIIYHIPAFNSL